MTLVRWRLANFMFFVAFLCLVLYNIVITSFHKASINVEPLSPPILKKSPHIENQKHVFRIRVFAFAFFYCFTFWLICWYPLPPPWASLVPFLVDCSAPGHIFIVLEANWYLSDLILKDLQ